MLQVRSLVWHQMTTLVLVVGAAFCSHVAVKACTVFFAFDGRAAIAGQNEDWDGILAFAECILPRAADPWVQACHSSTANGPRVCSSPRESRTAEFDLIESP